MQNKILILAAEDKIRNYAISTCDEKNIEYDQVQSVKEASESLSTSEYTISLISYSAISNSNREQTISLFKNTKKSKFIVFDVPQDAKKRLAFYKLGAYRILDSNYNHEEIMHVCSNILKQRDRTINEDESRFSGNLQDFNLAELINRFGKEHLGDFFCS